MTLKILLVFLPTLIALYFILDRYNVNIDELSRVDLFSTLLVFLPIIAFISLIPKLIIKNFTKYLLILSVLVTLFFTYTSIHNFLYEYEIFDYSIGSHKILIPLMLVFLISGSW